MKRIADNDRPRYVLYFRGHIPPDVNPRIWVPIFFDPAVARAALMKFLGSLEYTRDGNVIRVADSSLTVTCDQLDTVLDADETSTLSDETARNCLRFRLGSWDEDHSSPDEEVVETPEGEPVKRVKKAKPPRPKRASKPDNFVTIGELCKKWKIKPLHARTALRASDLEKPEFGWAFDPKDVPKIKKICGVK